MNVLGFNFTKMHVERENKLPARLGKSLNLDFVEITKENLDLVKAAAVYNLTFRYTVDYFEAGSKKESGIGKVLLEGVVTISLDKEEDKDFSKGYKKKEMSNAIKEQLFNFLLKKCTPRAIDMEDQINLPTHIPIPLVSLNWDENKK